MQQRSSGVTGQSHRTAVESADHDPFVFTCLSTDFK